MRIVAEQPKANTSVKRNVAFDISRFVFAFFIVVIHVPGWGWVIPFSRCGVPFFFLLSGYYLYASDKNLLGSKSLRSAKKWFMLWLTYTVVFSAILFLLKINYMEFALTDMIELLRTGITTSLDLVIINESIFGISVLWFLHAGMLAFLFVYFIRKIIYTRLVNVLMVVWTLFAVSINYFEGKIVIDRSLSVAVTFIYAGMLLKKHMAALRRVSNRQLMLIMGISLITLYIEAIWARLDMRNVEIYYSTIVLTIVIFVYLSNNPDLFGLKQLIPTKVSMDIYLWHRLVYAFLFGLLPMTTLRSIAPILIYVFTLGISWGVRSLWINYLVRRC